MSKHASPLWIMGHWADIVEPVVFDIAAYRDRFEWRDSLRDPWPIMPPEADFSITVQAVCDAFGKVVLNWNCVQEITNYARVWIERHDPSVLPEWQDIYVTWQIAKLSMRRACFYFWPDFRRDSSTHFYLRRFIRLAMQVRDAWEECKGLPENSRHLARFWDAVYPRTERDMSRSPVALCIHEARTNGELATLADRIESLDSILSSFVGQAARVGHVSGDCFWGLNNKILELSKFIPTTVNPETASSAKNKGGRPRGTRKQDPLNAAFDRIIKRDRAAIELGPKDFLDRYRGELPRDATVNKVENRLKSRRKAGKNSEQNPKTG